MSGRRKYIFLRKLLTCDYLCSNFLTSILFYVAKRRKTVVKLPPDEFSDDSITEVLELEYSSEEYVLSGEDDSSDFDNDTNADDTNPDDSDADDVGDKTDDGKTIRIFTRVLYARSSLKTNKTMEQISIFEILQNVTVILVVF